MNLRLGSLKGEKVETRSEFLFLKHDARTLGDTHTHNVCQGRMQMEFISGSLPALYVIKRPPSSCLSFKAEAASTSGLEAPSPPAPPFLMGQIKQPSQPFFCRIYRPLPPSPSPSF